MFFTLGSSLNNNSDSEEDDLAWLRIDDWQVFEMDREVRKHKSPSTFL